LFGPIGDRGVHAHHRHWRALAQLARGSGLPGAVVRAITDGRDTGPTSGYEFMAALCTEDAQQANVRIGTVCGRYYAMDRDKRWERTERAWNTFVHGNAASSAHPLSAIKQSYEAGTTDEFIEPVVIDGPDTRIQSGDAVIFVNFR